MFLPVWWHICADSGNSPRAVRRWSGHLLAGQEPHRGGEADAEGPAKTEGGFPDYAGERRWGAL